MSELSARVTGSLLEVASGLGDGGAGTGEVRRSDVGGEEAGTGDDGGAVTRRSCVERCRSWRRRLLRRTKGARAQEKGQEAGGGDPEGEGGLTQVW